MANHRGIAIIDQFTTLLMNKPLVGDNVFKGRIYDMRNTPSHSIYLGSATVSEINIGRIDVSQLVRDEVVVVGAEEELDELLLNVHAEAYQAIMVDKTLGLAYVEDTVLESMTQPDYIGEGKRPILSAVFTWRVDYRHSVTDPST